MKKTYIQPSLKVKKIAVHRMIALSIQTTDESAVSSYGVDANSRTDIWGNVYDDGIFW